MSVKLTRSHATDSYEMLSSHTANPNLEEVAIVDSLVKGSLGTISNNKMTSPANSSSWTYTKLNNECVDTSALYNFPPGSVTKNSVISLEHTAPSSLNSYSALPTYGPDPPVLPTYGPDPPALFKMLGSSSSAYDSNLVVEQSYLDAFFDSAVSNDGVVPLDAKYKATFDKTNPNYIPHMVASSRWNTNPGPFTSLAVVGTDPVAVTEDIVFNTTVALGGSASGIGFLSKYGVMDTSNGSISTVDIPGAYQPINNNLTVEDRTDYTNFSAAKDIGIYKLQNSGNSITTKIELNSGAGVEVSNYLNTMPLMDTGAAYGNISGSTTKSSVLAPNVSNNNNFNSLFNAAVLGTISDNYQFQITIEDDSAGYSLNKAGITDLLISELDNTDIRDNVLYMTNYVNQDHSITFVEGAVGVETEGESSSSNLRYMSVDLSAGEKLTNTHAGVDGQIQINSNTEATRVKDFVASGQGITMDSTDVKVLYSGVNHISDDMMKKKYLKVYDKKVALRTSAEPASNVFLSNNSAILSMTIDGNLVNDKVSKTNNVFEFNNTFADDDLRIWKIDSVNVLISETQSLCKTFDTVGNVANDPVKGIQTQGVLKNLTESLMDYDSYRVVAVPKQLSDIGLNTVVNATSNWSLSYTDPGDQYLISNTNTAFDARQSLPHYNTNLISLMDSGAKLDFTYNYSTQPSGLTQGGLSDVVKVLYKQQGSSEPATIFYLPSSDIVRTDVDVPVITTSDVSVGSYSLNGGIWNMEHWKLVSVTSAVKYNVSFPANYGVYDNITLSIANITQNNTYFALKNIATGALAPHSALRFVTTPSISNLADINETISTGNNDTLTISGVLDFNDLKGLKSYVEGKNQTSASWGAISNTIDFDPFYGTDNKYELSISNTSNTEADVVINAEFSAFYSSNNLVVLNNNMYFITLIYNEHDAVHTVSSFKSSVAGLATTTTLSDDSTSYLTVANNYASISSGSWVSNEYNISVVNNSNATTTFSVYNQTIRPFSITRPSNQIYLGSQVVSYFKNDVHRVRMDLGNSPLDCTSTIAYQSIGDLSKDMTFDVIPGIEIASVGASNVGSALSFVVKGDYVVVDLVGQASAPTSSDELGTINNGGLEFQFGKDTTNYSAKLTLDRFRGFVGPANGANTGVHTYKLARSSTSATFKVGSELSQTLTSNMYWAQNMIVDSLVRGGAPCGALGIRLSASYSIAPGAIIGNTRVYPITVKGDKAMVQFTNAEYAGNASNITVPSGSTPVLDPKSYSVSLNLTDQNLYKFSGVYAPTSQIVSLTPSRVKMDNSTFPYQKMVYKIALTQGELKVYKAISSHANLLNYIGNPAQIGSNDPLDESDPTKWSLVSTLSSYSDKLSGINLGKKLIKQNASKNVKVQTSFYVSLPPQHLYEIVSIEDGIPQIYNYSELAGKNKVSMFMPYDESITKIEPFGPLMEFRDINGNNLNITHNAQNINNVEFTHLKVKTMLDLTKDATAEAKRYGIIVPGTNLKIIIWNGLHPSTLKPHTLYDAPVTSMSSELDVSKNKVVFRSREADGSIKFSVAQDPTDVGYAAGLQGYKNLFKTEDQVKFYNLDLSIGNALWCNKNLPTTFFNANANGVRPTLYTVKDLNNPITKSNYRRVYKYTSESALNIEDTDTLQTLNLSFTSGRKYFDIEVNKPVFSATSANVWDYPSLVASTNIGNLSSITWVDDSNFGDNSVSVGWSFGNAVTGRTMPIDLFYIDNEETKWVFMNFLPFQSLLNQYNLTVSETAWDGSLQTPLVATQFVNLKAKLEDSILNGPTYEIEEYSVSRL